MESKDIKRSEIEAGRKFVFLTHYKAEDHRCAYIGYRSEFSEFPYFIAYINRNHEVYKVLDFRMFATCKVSFMEVCEKWKMNYEGTYNFDKS